MKTFLSKLYNHQISSKGLGVFRFFFTLILLLEVLQIFQFRHLYYDPIPYVQTSLLSNQLIWYIWMCVLLMLILGIKTRFVAIINYIFILAFIIANVFYEYHMDYAYVGMSFLMIILPVSKSYSIDNLILRISYSSRNKLFIPSELTSKFNYFLIIVAGVGFVYFDSIFFKFKSLGWSSGLGMWLPASLPQITISSSQWLLNQEWLIVFLGYFTFAFELIFPFVFLNKKFRWILLIIGLGLHFGILLSFPIPYFAIGVLAIYIALVPVSCWSYIEKIISVKSKKITFFYDEECPLCLRTKIIITFFDVFKAVEFKSVQSIGDSVVHLKNISEEELLDNIYSVDNKGNLRNGVDTYFKVFSYIPMFFVFLIFKLPGLYQLSKLIYGYIAKNRTLERCSFDNCVMPGTVNKYIDVDQVKIFKNLNVFQLKKRLMIGVFLFLTFLQLNVSFNSFTSGFVINKFDKNTIMYKSLNSIKFLSKKTKNMSHYFFGITNHGVFIDGHFKEFKKLYALKYKGVFLPIIDEKGMPGEYLRGGLWVNHNWRVNGPRVDVVRKKSIERLEVGLGRFVGYWAYKNEIQNPVFELVEKNINVPYRWEKDLLKNNINSPWKKVGIANYQSQTGELEFTISSDK